MCGESAWTGCCCSTAVILSACCGLTSSITTGTVRVEPWRNAHRLRGLGLRPSAAHLSPSTGAIALAGSSTSTGSRRESDVFGTYRVLGFNGKRSDIAGSERQVDYLKSRCSSSVFVAESLDDANGSPSLLRLLKQGKKTATSRLGKCLKTCPVK